MLPRYSPIAAALVLALSTSLVSQTQIMVDAGRGPVLVRLPASYTGQQPIPMLLMLHAYLQPPAIFESFMGLTAAADANGIATVHPMGLPDVFGVAHWNATTACCAWFGPGNDDSGYLRNLIDEVKLNVNIAPSRVHVAGYSNGAYMAYRMACDHADVIASIVSIAGSTWNDPTLCVPSAPLHVLHIHGDEDTWVEYGGGLEVGGNPHPSVAQTLSYWAGYNGCAIAPTGGSTPLDLDVLVPGAETAVAYYENACQPGGSVEHWRMRGANHFPVWQPSFAPLLTQWILAHSKPGTWTDTGNDLGGTYGPPVMQPNGTVNPGTIVSFAASNALENTPAVFIIGATAVNSPLAGGVLGPSMDFSIFGLVSNPVGELNLSFGWPAGMPIGAAFYFQYWFQDAGGRAGLASTTTWRLVLP
ncbi:MAG: polyhydroxybutyrate depolymerase [Planctomycetota bacterium]|jgi:polyhydroxybutyrate depolymerase